MSSRQLVASGSKTAEMLWLLRNSLSASQSVREGKSQCLPALPLNLGEAFGPRGDSTQSLWVLTGL